MGFGRTLKRDRQAINRAGNRIKYIFKKKNQPSKRDLKKASIAAGKAVGDVGFAIARGVSTYVPGLQIVEPYLDTLQKDMHNGNFRETKYLATHPVKYLQRLGKEVFTGYFRDIPFAGHYADQGYEAIIHGNENRLTEGGWEGLLNAGIEGGLHTAGIPGASAIADRASRAAYHGNAKELTRDPDNLVMAIGRDAATSYAKSKLEDGVDSYYKAAETERLNSRVKANEYT